MVAREQQWIETPGFTFILKELVPEAAEALKSDENYEPVLIVGPTGVGKSYIQDEIQKGAGFAKNEVLRVNCAAINPNLIESEIFGHVKGAFTDAKRANPGFLAAPGIKLLVLEELGSLPPYCQSKLLVFLDNGEYRNVGSNKIEKSQMKILGVANENLEKERASFRDDFLFRFRVISIPGLHTRRQDIPFLLACFAPNVEWTRGDLLRLMAYHWPGNVRELERFSKTASKFWPKVNTPSGHMGSVLLWLQSYRGLEHGIDNPEPIFGVPEFRSIKGLHTILGGSDSPLFDEINEFVPPLALGKHAFKKVDHDLKDDISWMSWWSNWCCLFCQDPTIDADVLDLISRRKATATRYDHYGRYDERDANTRYDSLASRIYNELYLTSGESGQRQKEKEEDFSQIFKAVLDKIDPAGYKEKWIQHCRHLAPKKVAKIYGMNESSVRTLFHRNKISKKGKR